MYHFGATPGGVAIGVATIFEKMGRFLGFLEVGGGFSGRDATYPLFHSDRPQ